MKEVILFFSFLIFLSRSLLDQRAMASRDASALCLLVAVTIILALPASSSSGRKELRGKEINMLTSNRMDKPLHSDRVDPSRVVQVSWHPRVFVYKGFLSDEECDHLVLLANGQQDKNVRSSEDLENAARQRRLLDLRELSDNDDELVGRIEERISGWTFLPKENGRPLQFFDAELDDAKHSNDYNDYTSPSSPNVTVATVVLYLSDVAKGGQIHFPKTMVKGESRSNCRNSKEILRPVKGNAILFFMLLPDASPDPRSAHTKCPVLEGKLHYAMKSFNVRALGQKKPVQPGSGAFDGECTDEDDNCPGWAIIGECQKNPVYMIGTPDYYGACRKSCNAC